MFRGLLHIVAVVALGILVGSLLFFGSGVAGVIFREGLLPSRTLAGGVNGAIIHRLAVMQGIVAVLAFLSLATLALTNPRGTSRIAAVAALFALAGAVYSGVILLPEISSLRFEIADFDHILESKKAAHERFGELHSRYTMIAMIQLATGGLALILHSLWVWRRGGTLQKPAGEEIAVVEGKKKNDGKKRGNASDGGAAPKEKTSPESSENVTGLDETPKAS